MVHIRSALELAIALARQMFFPQKMNVIVVFQGCVRYGTGMTGTGMDVRNFGVSGTGIHVVPRLPKCPVRVLMLYRTYRSVRYR